MDYSERLNQAWNLHAEAPEQVAQLLGELFDTVNTEQEAVAFLELSSHVLGGHLGLWDEAEAWANKLALHRLGAGEQLARAIQVKKQAIALAAGSGAASAAADGAQVQASAEAADLLGEQGRCEEAVRILREAVPDPLPTEIDREATHAIAISSNNLAWKLLENKDVSAASELAQLSLQAWRTAGGWMEVERAHYLISQCHAAAGNGKSAIKAAEECLAICERHQAEPGELFYACEGVALAYAAASQATRFDEFRKRARKLFDQLSDEERAMCADAMRGLDEQKVG